MRGTRGLGAEGSGARPLGSPLPHPSICDLGAPQQYTWGRWHGRLHFKMCPSVPPIPPAHNTFSLRLRQEEWYAALSETPDPRLSLQGEGLSILPSPRTRGLSNSEEGRAGQGLSCWKGPALSFFPSLLPCFLCPTCYRPGIAPIATW